MKRFLLTAMSALVAGAGVAQSQLNLTTEQNSFKLEAPVTVFEQQHPNAALLPNVDQIQVEQRSATETQIGNSYYDLQTNSAIQRRIILHSNSTITATWTFSPDAA